MPLIRNACAQLGARLLCSRRAVVAVVFLGGALFYTVLGYDNWREMRQDLEESFRAAATEHFRIIKEEIEEPVERAGGVAAFLRVVGPADSLEFRNVALLALRGTPEIAAVFWAPRVSASGDRRLGDREPGAPVAEYRGEGAGAPQDLRFRVRYWQTLTGAEPIGLSGHDLSDTPAVREALRRARDTGERTATPALQLQSGQKELHVYWPVYWSGTPLDTVEQRGENLRGVVGAVFPVRELARSTCRGVAVVLIDEDAPPEARVLSNHSCGEEPPARPWTIRRYLEDRARANLRWTGPLEVGGRRWTVSITPTAAFSSSRVTGEMWWDFLLGLVITALVAGYLLLLMRRTDEVERHVATRTQELQRAHDQLVAEVNERTRAEALARRLTLQLVSVQEAERRHLSRELHDEAGQALTSLVLSLRLMHADMLPEHSPIRHSLHEAANLAHATLERLRLLARGLRPPALDTLGLDACLKGLCQEMSHRANLPITYIGGDVSALPDAVATCLYRVLQEGLTNAIKHAGASQVHVSLRVNAEMAVLSIEDDGRGFSLVQPERPADKPGSLGLLGMAERLELIGGTLNLTSHPGQGTILIAEIPLAPLTVDDRRADATSAAAPYACTATSGH
jgi:signal transduction histidine kinase